VSTHLLADLLACDVDAASAGARGGRRDGHSAGIERGDEGGAVGVAVLRRLGEELHHDRGERTRSIGPLRANVGRRLGEMLDEHRRRRRRGKRESAGQHLVGDDA
jgi:hypothetical protein